MSTPKNVGAVSVGVQGVSNGERTRFVGKAGRSGPPGHNHSRQHGGWRARVELKELKRRRMDGRTSEAREVVENERELIASLGGDENVSVQRRWLIHDAAVLRFELDRLNAFTVTMQSLVNKKRRQLYPIVREKQALVASLRAILSDLGLERQARTVGLKDYIESSARNTPPDAQPAPESDAPEKPNEQ